MAEKQLPDRSDSGDLSARDQSTADADQSTADLDQSGADSDQASSERDQRASDSDQKSADREEELAERTEEDGEGKEEEEIRARSRRDRSHAKAERDSSTEDRSEVAEIREDNAARRDRTAAERDAAALARDQIAAMLDAEIERLERDHEEHAGAGGPLGPDPLLRSAKDRERAADIRDRAAAHRDAAARDRAASARDRKQAAADRKRAAAALESDGIDDLTGTLRRRIGLAALQREMDRTERSNQQLVVAFVDIDGLKVVNDGQGHLAGDEILRRVSACLRHHLRSYDVILRFGGDEFVCSLAGQDASGASERFVEIQRQLASEPGIKATFTVGLAERRPDETLSELVHRADRELIASRADSRRSR